MKKYQHQRIVCIGGGTGLSTMLRGLKKHTPELTAIVTVADNGGSSGILRREMNMLPPGDIRNCLLALAETEPIMEQVFQYRFKEGSMAGQNFGNLFLAALTDIYGNFEKAVDKANQVLAVTGSVIPVTTENVQLEAIYEDGTTVLGEHEIVYTNKYVRKKIRQVHLVPNHPPAYIKALEAIAKSDIIVLGPGSLYTSIIPNLLVDGIGQAIQNSMATKIYVGNIMTQPGETDHYSLKMHVEAIEEYLGKQVIEYVIASNPKLDNDTKEHYLEDRSFAVKNDLTPVDAAEGGYQIIESDFAIIDERNEYVRHDADKLADIILAIGDRE